MRIRLAIPDRVIGPDTLEPLLEATTRANEALISRGEAPTMGELLRAGVRWKPEPPWGHEALDLGPTVLHRGWGDCDDLGPIAAASDRITGRDPGARAVVRRSGPNSWHALVEHSDGSLEDPSKQAGMPVKHGAHSPVTNRMHGGICIGVRPWGGLWHSRVDVPWAGDDTGSLVAGYAMADEPADAIERAMHHVATVGVASGCASPESLTRLSVFGALAQGAPMRDISARLRQRGIDPSCVMGMEDLVLEASSPIPPGHDGLVQRFDRPSGPVLLLRFPNGQ